MMMHQLAIQARSCPEILERVLRVVRHRGFNICAMKMDLAKGSEGDNVNIELTISSLRPLALLCTQLVKLADVADVEICTQKRENYQHISRAV
ncbi:acetolactate synthase 2 small subunit [Morganella psychrotolerans]|uniref:Acetolactate synthase 2 regulatory subunit n=1 Tax=Morganella psychrotolerans TaxID=368603 RepID=A0A1B8HK64_9GAMM|nr:acetolactate synthase 2 small subunit [Morganella psychrotolerans]OBU09386.1 acetolactate synthase 2 regulatory subunit [Morganella psychrotolerans]